MIVLYKLTILKIDDSVYWIERFNKADQMTAWLTEEQTRPYWDNAWTYSMAQVDDEGNESPYTP
jgi:hypothetical protein